MLLLTYKERGWPQKCEQPVIFPPLLMAMATLDVPPGKSQGPSCARFAKQSLMATIGINDHPTTWPRLLRPLASAWLPPNVPKSICVFRGGIGMTQQRAATKNLHMAREVFIGNSVSSRAAIIQGRVFADRRSGDQGRGGEVMTGGQQDIGQGVEAHREIGGTQHRR